MYLTLIVELQTTQWENANNAAIADYTMGECQQCCNCRHEAEHVGTTLEVDELTSNNKNKSIKYSSHHVIRLFWHTRCDSLDDDIMTVIRT